MEEEIQRRFILIKMGYFSFQMKSESKLLSKTTKSLPNNTLVVAVLLYASETSVLSRSTENVLGKLIGKY